MTFLNTTLLVALAAVGIPIALHLLARKEPKQVVFPSVRLLTHHFETNRSKVRIRRWWLLALRIAAIAVVAFALARPVISGGLSLTWTTIGILSIVGVSLLALASFAASKPNQKTLMWSLLVASVLALLGALAWGGYTMASGTKPVIDVSMPVALAIVVDNTPLAAWRTADDYHLDRLRAAAKQLILAANPNSRVTLVDRSSTPATFALDLTSAVSKADALQSLEVVQPLESRIEAAARLLQTSDIESRQLVIISGLAESSFAKDSWGQDLAGLMNELGVRVTVWDLGGFSGVNRKVSIPTLSDRSPAPEASIVVAAVLSLENRPSDSDQADPGPSEKVRATVECVLFPSHASLPVVRNGEIIRPDAKPVDRANVELTPGRDVEVRLALPPLPVGLYHGAIRLIGEDALAIDDTGFFTVAVLPPSRLLLVSDDPEQAAEIAWAVSAPAPVDDPSSQYAIERIAYGDLAASRMSDFDGVILLDPPASALGESELDRYRASGGSVLVAVGSTLGQDKVTVDGWPTFQRRWRVPPPGTFLEITAASHPAMVSLAITPGGVPFQDFRVQQYWQVDVASQIDSASQGQVLMRYAGSGHPALVELSSSDSDNESSGATVLLLTTPIPDLIPPSKSWNELFSADEPWPAFVLVRDLTRYLTNRSADAWTSSVGSPVSIPLRIQVESEGNPQRLQWFPPMGSTPVPIDLPESDGASSEIAKRIVVGQPKHSGVHWVRGADQGLGFTVNLPRERLTATRIDPQDLNQMLGEDQFQQIDSLDDMEWTAGDEDQLVSLWSPMMLLALFVFLLEQILSNRFYRHQSVQRGTTA